MGCSVSRGVSRSRFTVNSPLHAGDNDIAVPRLFSTVHNQQIAIVQTAVGHAVSAGTQVVRRARMPYAVIMEIQIGLDIVSSRAGKTAAGQIGKQWMGLWREFFPVLKSCSFIFPPDTLILLVIHTVFTGRPVEIKGESPRPLKDQQSTRSPSHALHTARYGAKR